MRWLALAWLAGCAGEVVECSDLVAIEVACDVTGWTREIHLAGLQLVEVHECCEGVCYPAEGWSLTGDAFAGRCSCGTFVVHVSGG